MRKTPLLPFLLCTFFFIGFSVFFLSLFLELFSRLFFFSPHLSSLTTTPCCFEHCNKHQEKKTSFL